MPTWRWYHWTLFIVGMIALQVVIRQLARAFGEWFALLPLQTQDTFFAAMLGVTLLALAVALVVLLVRWKHPRGSTPLATVSTLNSGANGAKEQRRYSLGNGWSVGIGVVLAQLLSRAIDAGMRTLTPAQFETLSFAMLMFSFVALAVALTLLFVQRSQRKTGR